MTDELPVIPRMGTPKMHMIERSRVIGWMPKPETRGTEWRQAGREVFGETIKGSQRQSDRSHYRQCSANRKPAHQKLQCLGITIDEKGVTWGCNHCNWKGGGSYEPYPAKKNGGGLPFVTQYIYRQADSAPYLKVCRTAEKQFPQFHWDGSGWKKGKPNGPKIPYRLPELLAASVGTTIYFCEGEKDADAVHALGLLGTTCSEGAPNGWREELAPWFKDRHVVVLPDNDLAGRKLARKVAKSLFGIAASVKIVELLDLKEGQDVSDFLTRDRAGVKFIQLCKAAPLWEPSTDRDGGKDDTSDDELIAQLAALPRIEYAKRRKDAAKGLGITLAELDKIVAEARGETSAATPGALVHRAVGYGDQHCRAAGRPTRYVYAVHYHAVTRRDRDGAVDAARLGTGRGLRLALPDVLVAGDAVWQEHRACGPVSGWPAHCPRQQHLAGRHFPVCRGFTPDFADRRGGNVRHRQRRGPRDPELRSHPGHGDYHPAGRRQPRA
jgi:5S rRNA maturation endonuclease (ribonuclease M5)